MREDTKLRHFIENHPADSNLKEVKVEKALTATTTGATRRLNNKTLKKTNLSH